MEEIKVRRVLKRESMVKPTNHPGGKHTGQRLALHYPRGEPEVGAG